MILTGENRSTQRKPCPSGTLSTINATKTDLVLKPGLCYLCVSMCLYIQGVTGGKDQTSGECSLGQTIPI